jgi:lipid II:glycine glycyltransferase (peptidoglycan interpeptide bridge formation enzyme)
VFYAAYTASVDGFDRSRGRAVHELDTARRYAYWVACDAEGAVLATLGTYRYGDLLTEIMSARTPAGVAAGLPAQDMLHWEVMRDHRGSGGRWFDLAGYAEAPGTPKEEGIRRFKRKWAGREVSTPTFTKLVGGRLQRGLARLRSLRR